MKIIKILLLICCITMISIAQQNKITYYEIKKPEYLDPVYGNKFIYGRRCSSLLFRGLYGYNKTGEFIDLIADGRPNPMDGSNTKFTLQIRPNMKWHDGVNITSDDVVRSFQILKNENTLYGGKEILKRFNNISPDGNLGLIIELNSPNPQPEYIMIFPILPAHLLRSVYLSESNQFTTNPIGNGPFKIESKEIDKITFTRFDDFEYAVSDGHQTNIEKVILEEKNEMFWTTDLTAGHVDLLVQVPLQQVIMLEGLENVTYKEYPNYSIDMLGFNMRDSSSLLNLKFIREAIYRGFNRKKAIMSAYNNNANIVSGPYPFGSPFYWGEIDYKDYEYDKDAAIKLLENNGCTRPDVKSVFSYNGKKLSFDIIAIQSLGRSRIITQIIADLKQIGIEIKDPIYLTPDVYNAYLNQGKFDIVWITPNYNEDFDISPLFHSKSPYNFWGYQSSTVDDLLNKLTQTSDPLMQLSYGHQIHQKIHEDIPCFFLWTKKKYAGYTRRMKVFDPHPLDFFQTINEWELRE